MSFITVYLKKYLKQNNFDFFYKNLKFLTAVLLLLLLGMNCILFYFYSKSITRDFDNMNEKLLSKSGGYIDNVMAQVNNDIALLSGNTKINTFLTVQNDNMDISQISKNFSDINSLIGAIISANPFIDSIYVYSEANGYIISNIENNSPENFSDKDWLAGCDKNDSAQMIWSAVRTVNNPQQMRPYNVISVFRKIYPHVGYYGVIAVNIHTEKLSDWVFSESERLENMLVADSDGSIIFNSSDIQAVKISDEPYLIKSLPEGDGNIKGDNYYMYTMSSSQVSWNYILSVPNEVYNSRQLLLRIFMFISCAVCIIIAIVFSFYINLRAYTPIKSIMSILDNPDIWADNHHISQYSNTDEIKFIIDKILNSINKNREMEENTAVRMALLKKAQNIALQSQINPHFLFNTLEAVYLSAVELTGGENQASELISSLSELVRMSFLTKDMCVPLETELKYTRKYLEIQSIRYGDRFEAKFEIPDDILDCKIVKLTLQPLVENAIYHGIKPAKYKCLLTVKGYISGNLLCIDVIDDGVGIPSDRLVLLNSKLESDAIAENDSIGICNVHRRLQLTYGAQYGLSIKNNDTRGTTVSLVIPI